MESEVIFSKRLKEVMKERKISATKLGKQIGVTRQAICGYINGGTNHGVNKVKDMCLALDVSCDYLLGLSDKKNIEDSIEKYMGISIDLIEKIRKLDEEAKSALDILVRKIG